MPLVTESGDALWKRFVEEWRIELVFEEFRFFDIRRWKVATEVFSQDRYRMDVYRDPVTGEKTCAVQFFQPGNFDDHNYLAPIPRK